MTKIKRFKIRDDILQGHGLQMIRGDYKEGGSWIREDVKWFISFPLNGSIELDVGLPDDISKWNDLNYVLVLDDDFGQPYVPYVPFYVYMGNPEPSKETEFLKTIIVAYNEKMSQLLYLEEIV